jgi:hypothetical protein
MHDLSAEVEVKEKMPKVKKYKRIPLVWYKPFNYMPPVFETVLDVEGNPVKDRKGNDKVRIKVYPHWKLNHNIGDVVVSGEGDAQRSYTVQKTGAIVRIDKKPSKRDLHRAKAKTK